MSDSLFAMVHAALLAMDKVYSDLRREVETFTNDRDSLNQQVLESREELDKLRHLVSSETNAIDTERKDLESEKAEFESFRTEALSQMESFREQLEVRKRPPWNSPCHGNSTTRPCVCERESICVSSWDSHTKSRRILVLRIVCCLVFFRFCPCSSMIYTWSPHISS